MTKHFNPSESYFLVTWSELEQVLNRTSAPSKKASVAEGLDAIRVLKKDKGPSVALYTLVTMIAWLHDEEADLSDLADNHR